MRILSKQHKSRIYLARTSYCCVHLLEYIFLRSSWFFFQLFTGHPFVDCCWVPKPLEKSDASIKVDPRIEPRVATIDGASQQAPRTQLWLRKGHVEAAPSIVVLLGIEKKSLPSRLCTTSRYTRCFYCSPCPLIHGLCTTSLVLIIEAQE